MLPAPPWLVERIRPKVAAVQPVSIAAALPRHRYLSAAVKGEIQRVLDAQPGTRNAALCRAAYSLGQLVGVGALDDTAVGEALVAAALAAGLSETEARRTTASGISAGRRSPRGVQ